MFVPKEGLLQHVGVQIQGLYIQMYVSLEKTCFNVILYVTLEKTCFNVILYVSLEKTCFNVILYVLPPKEKPVHVFRDMTNVKATPGEDAELSCEITKPEAFIRWLKNGHQIRHSPPKYEISVEDHLVRLVITNTCIRDSGEYCCEADGIATRAKLEVRGKY